MFASERRPVNNWALSLALMMVLVSGEKFQHSPNSRFRLNTTNLNVTEANTMLMIVLANWRRVSVLLQILQFCAFSSSQCFGTIVTMLSFWSVLMRLLAPVGLLKTTLLYLLDPRYSRTWWNKLLTILFFFQHCKRNILFWVYDTHIGFFTVYLYITFMNVRINVNGFEWKSVCRLGHSRPGGCSCSDSRDNHS